jgi:hypothetical protein
MLMSAVVAGSIASVMTAVFAFRFRTWKAPRRLASYFATFFGLELAMERFVLPPGLLGIEVAAVCFAIALLFVGAILATRHLEQDDGEEF